MLMRQRGFQFPFLVMSSSSQVVGRLGTSDDVVDHHTGAGPTELAEYKASHHIHK